MSTRHAWSPKQKRVRFGLRIESDRPARTTRTWFSCDASTLAAGVLWRLDQASDNVARGAEVHTDAWQGDNDIGRDRFKHVVTNVSQSGDPAHVALPHGHRVAWLVQRWILGTHQRAVSHEQLAYYLDEFTFRFNRRHSRHRGLLFYRLLEGALAADPQPYKTLTSESGRQPDPA